MLDDNPRVRCVDLARQRSSENQELCFAPLSGRAAAVHPIVARALAACDRFEALDAHLRSFERDPALAQVPRAVLEDALENAVRAGLLTPEREVRDRCVAAARDGDDAARVASIAIATRDRPEVLARSVESYAVHLRDHGRDAEIVVSDDSVAPATREATRATLTTLATRYGVRIAYAGAEQKAAFARALLAESGANPVDVEFALSNPEQLGWTEGANRNALLLDTVGEALLCVDDDTICASSTLPDAGAAGALDLSSTNDPTSFWFFPDHDAAVAAAHFTDDDFLAAHETLLGRDVGRLVAGGQALGLDAMQASFLHRLEQAGGRVAFTMAGSVGDSGMGMRSAYFFVDAASRERLLASDPAYRAALASRQVMRGVTRPTITNQTFCMGLNLGLDNRALLPPFVPVQNNADGAFGHAVRACVSDAFAGYVPRALLHRTVTTRVFDFDDLVARTGTPSTCDLIPLVLSTWQAPPGPASTRARMRSLGDFLCALGALPETELRRTLAALWWRLSAHTLARLGEIERAGGERSAQWGDDARRYAEARTRGMLDGCSIGPRDLAEQRGPDDALPCFGRIVARYGALLRVWPDLVDGAKALRQRGVRVAETLASKGTRT